MANQDGSDRSDGVNKVKGGSAFSEFEKRIEESRRPTIQERELQERITRNKNLINTLEQGISAGVSDEKMVDRMLSAISKGYRSVARDEPRLTQISQSRLERQGLNVSSSVERMFSQSAIHGQISEISRTPSAINQSAQLIQTPYETLETQKQEYFSRINELRERAAGASYSLITDPERRTERRKAALRESFEERQGLLNKAASIEVAQRTQRHLGLDPQSRLEDLYKAGQMAQSVIGQEDIKRQISRGSVSISEGGAAKDIKLSEINNELIKQSRELVESLKRLGSATDDVTRTKEQENAQKIKENIETLKGAGRVARESSDISSEAQYNKYAKIASYSSIAGRAVDELFVGSRMRTMSNQQGFANLENQKYDTYRAALSGDMASLMMLSQFSEAKSFGKQLFLGRQTVNLARMAEAGAQIGMGKAMTAGGVATAAINGGTAAAQGAQMTVEGYANLGLATYDEYQGAAGPGGTANTVDIQAQQQRLAAAEAIFKVSAFQRQQLYNYSTGMGRAAIGMGRQGEAFLQKTLGNQEYLGKMQGLNISPDEMAKMTSFGVNNIGSTFNENMAFAARGLERSGMGTREENLQRMSILAQAGANNPQAGLASTLEAAVGKGFDNSKSMTMLVQHTGEMAKQSAVSIAAGADVTGSIATILAAGADKNMPNREFALERSRTVQESLKEAATNTSTDLMGLLNTSNISAQTGLGAISAEAAANLTPADLASMRKMSSNEKKAFLIQRGIDPSEFKGGVDEGINTLQRTQMQAMLGGRGGEGLAKGTEAIRESVMNKVQSGKDYGELGEQEQLFLSRLKKGVTGAEMYRGLAATRAVNAEGSREEVDKLMKGQLSESDALRKAADEALTASSGQLTDAARAATKEVGDAAKALKGFAEIFKTLRASGYEEKATTAAAEAAGKGKSLDETNKMFNDSVGAFGRHIDSLGKIVEKANLSGTLTLPPQVEQTFRQLISPKPQPRQTNKSRPSN